MPLQMKNNCICDVSWISQFPDTCEVLLTRGCAFYIDPNDNKYYCNEKEKTQWFVVFGAS